MHVDDEYDYRFDSPKREEIFTHLKRNYYAVTKKFLPIYSVPGKLQQYLTNPKDQFDMRSTTGALPPDEYLQGEESKQGVIIEDLSSEAAVKLRRPSKDISSEEEMKGNMLSQLESDNISDEAPDSEEETEETKFGLDDATYERGKSFFSRAKLWGEEVDFSDYVLNPEMRSVENPNQTAQAQDY